MASARKLKTTVFVGCLDRECTRENLVAVMSRFGEVVDICVKEAKDGQGSNFGFVEYSDLASAQRALCSGTVMCDGQRLTIRPTKKQQWRPNSDQVAAQPSKCVDVRLMITHVQSPNSLYAQPIDDKSSKLLLMVFQGLASYCASPKAISGPPSNGKIYGCKYTTDGNWYRCNIVSQVSASQVEVRYVDYGNTEVVDTGALVELPPELAAVPALAKMFHLLDIDVKDMPGTTKYNEGVAHLAELVDSMLLPAKLYDGDKVELLSGDIHIGKKMVSDGYCVFTSRHRSMSGHGDGAQKTGNAVGVGQGAETARYSVSQQTPALTTLESRERPAAHGRLTEPHAGRDVRKVPSLMDGFHERLSDGSCGQPSSSSVSDHSLSARGPRSALRCANERFKGSKAVDGEQACAGPCGTQAQLSAECSRLRAELEALKCDLPIGKRFVGLMLKAADVKRLRCMFPLDEDDPVANCVALLYAEANHLNNVIRPMCEDVEKAISSYNELKAELARPIGDKARMAEIITLRNEARLQLCIAIGHFDQSFQGLNLNERELAVEAALSQVKVIYAAFLDKGENNGSEDLAVLADEQLLQFSKWQADRRAAFVAHRNHTDTAVYELTGLLRHLQQSLDMSTDCPSPAALLVDSEQKFETAIVKCCDALTTEIERCEVGQGDTDAGVIQRTLRAILAQRAALQDEIATVRARAAEYSDLKNQLTPWLAQAPDLAPVLTLWKGLKVLRSRLRHLLAQRQDIVENINDDADKTKEDLDQCDEALQQLRLEIQRCCVSLEAALAMVATEVAENFPELMQQYTDLCFADVARCGGMYSPFRDLDYFIPDHNRSSCSNQVYLFNGLPVEIRQYHVGGTLRGDRSSALEYLVKVKDAWQEELLAVFFSKNPSEVLVQVRHHSQTLAAVKRPLESGAVAAYSRQILEQLQKMHNLDMVYGCLNPKTIFVEPTGCVLDVPGLLSHKTIVPVDMNGLTFNQEEASEYADLKDFGKVLIWMCSPENERPGHSHVSDDPELFELVTYLLNGQPKSAEEAMSRPYFTSTIAVHQTSASPLGATHDTYDKEQACYSAAEAPLSNGTAGNEVSLLTEVDAIATISEL